MNILQEANKIISESGINKERQYGGIVESLTNTAIVASKMLNKEITAKDVCTIFIASKFMRESVAHKKDNLIDAVAYTEMLNQVIEENKQFKTKN